MSDIIIKKHKRRDFLLCEKIALRDHRLSAKAKGLHCYLLSLPDNWQVFLGELSKHFKDGKDAIRAGIEELMYHGYVRRVDSRDDKGRFCYEYTIYETPGKEEVAPTASDFPTRESHDGFSNTDNPTLYNINKQNTNKQSINKAAAAETKANQTVLTATSSQTRLTSPTDHQLGETLTEWQCQRVETVANDLHAKHRHWPVKILVDGLRATLLDPAQFVKCGRRFDHKLAAIVGQFDKGRWTPVMAHDPQAVDAPTLARQVRLRELDGERLGLQSLRGYAEERGERIPGLEERLTAIDTEIHELRLSQPAVNHEERI